MLARRPRRVVVWKNPAPSWVAPLKSGLVGMPVSAAATTKASDSGSVMPPVGHRQRAAGAVIFVGAALLVLGLLEIGQHVVIAPAGIAALAPAIVILVLAAHIQQAVDRTRTAEHLSARLEHLPAVQSRLRLGLVHPVDGFFLEQFSVAERHVDPEIGVLRSGLQQQHGMLAVGAQAIGEHASGRAGADDDVVEFGSIIIIVHLFPRMRTERGSGAARGGQLPPGRRRGIRRLPIARRQRRWTIVPHPGMTKHSPGHSVARFRTAADCDPRQLACEFQKSGGRRSANAVKASRASTVLRRSANCSLSALICAEQKFRIAHQPLRRTDSARRLFRQPGRERPCFGVELVQRHHPVGEAPRQRGFAHRRLRRARTSRRRAHSRCGAASAGWRTLPAPARD